MIRVFFGNIGCGKSTLICKFIKQFTKRKDYEYYYTNLETKDLGAFFINSESLKTLGTWTPRPNSYFAIDESGIEFNNRNYKAMPQTLIKWLKLSRHYRCDVDVFSQSWEDMDVTIRRLASQLWYVSKLGPISIYRRVYKTVGIDDTTHQIIDKYRMEKGIWLILQPLKLLGLAKLLPQLDGWKFCYRPKYYRYFDSYAVPELPYRP